MTLDYHANGNLKYKSDYSQASEGAYQYASGKPHAVSQVTAVNGSRHCFTYDGAGNQLSHALGANCPGSAMKRTMTYEIGHRPETISGGISHNWQRLLFRYDAGGERYLQRQQIAGNPTSDSAVTLYPFPGTRSS